MFKRFGLVTAMAAFLGLLQPVAVQARDWDDHRYDRREYRYDRRAEERREREWRERERREHWIEHERWEHRYDRGYYDDPYRYYTRPVPVDPYYPR